MFHRSISVRLAACMLSVAVAGCAQESNHQNSTALIAPTADESVNMDAIEKWQAMRFGLFIHFGAYADLAGVWQGKQIEKLGEQIQRHADISQQDYHEVVKQFNPSNFDADAIVMLAKQAGMKYIVLTTKHHDGFALFDSKHTNYDIVDFTPYKKDLLKQLSEATKRYGLKLGLYYSTPDWHFNGPNPERNPDDGKISVFGKVSKANEDFQVAQLEELMTNYGDIVEVFFDMGEPTPAQSKRFRDTVKKYQPNALINGRVMNNQGDFLTLPDNHVPDAPIIEYPWESPGTFYHTWGYKSWVKGKPLEQQITRQIRKLSNIASMGGNFLLNIGPKGDGSVLAYEQDVLIGVGQWLDINKEAIFETGVNPFINLNWGQVSTGKNSLYLHIHQWPTNNKLVLPGLVNLAVAAKTLNNKEAALPVKQVNGNTIIDLSSAKKMPHLTVVKLSYEGELEVIPQHSSQSSTGTITLKGNQAVKLGKYGKESYRSMLKDFSRLWYVDVPQPGSYKAVITYNMKYDNKDFILSTPSSQTKFNLLGSGQQVKALKAFDGNENHQAQEQVERQMHKSFIGTVSFNKKGIQPITLSHGQSFELKASSKDFKAQDARYRRMNIDIESIKLFNQGAE